MKLGGLWCYEGRQTMTIFHSRCVGGWVEALTEIHRARAREIQYDHGEFSVHIRIWGKHDYRCFG
jgi:hypothetical protein